MEIPDESKKTLMQLVNELCEYLKHEKHKDSHYRPFWDHETKTVVLSEPYRLYLTLNAVTGSWHVMDSSCTSSVPCIVRRPLDNGHPKHIQVSALQIVVEMFQDKEETSPQTFIPYVVLIDFEVSENHLPRVPMKLLAPKRVLPPSQYVANDASKGSVCLLCRHENAAVDRPTDCGPDDGQVSELMRYNSFNVTTHSHYVSVQHKSVTQLKQKIVPQCHVVASLLQYRAHKENLLQFVMVLRGNLFAVSSLFQVGGILRMHLPVGCALPDLRAFAPPDVRVLPWVELPTDTAFFRHTCPLRSDPQPLAEVKGMTHQTGTLYNRKTLNQNFERERANKVDSQGFGVPGAKTVMLELRYGEGSDSTCVYLNNWGNKAYPLGLLDGTTVSLTNVLRKTSAKGSAYLVVTDLTGISLDSLPAFMGGSAWFPLADISLLSHLRAGSPVCGIVTAWRLLKVQLKHICLCSATRVRLVCPDVTCAAPGGSVRIVARARIITYGYGGPVLIHLKDDNVRILLGLSVEQWQVLQNLSFKNDMDYNCDNSYDPEEHTLAQNVFHAFCYRPRFNTALYVQCRKFAGERPMQMYPEHRPKDTPPIPQIFAFEVKLSPPEGQLWG